MSSEMIDWLTFTIPCHHTEEINGGYVVSTDRDGQREWVSRKDLHVEGSFDTKITVKTDYSQSVKADSFPRLRVSGNITKWFQGHNIFGTDDMHLLVMLAMEKLCEVLPLSPTQVDKDAWLKGNIDLTRIDITRSYSLSNRKTVLEWLHHAQLHANMAYRGKGILTGDTLYFGKKSKYSTLKAYSKGQEIEAHKVDAEVLTDSLREWAEDKLRIELTLRGRELRRIGKSKINDWQENDTNKILNEYMSRLEIASRINMTHEEIEKMPPRLRLAYQAWKDGNDLRKTVSRATYYRYKKELSELGIDITIPQTKKTPENVIPFVRVLEAKPCEQVPDWAYGTKLFLSR